MVVRVRKNLIFLLLNLRVNDGLSFFNLIFLRLRALRIEYFIYREFRLSESSLIQVNRLFCGLTSDRWHESRRACGLPIQSWFLLFFANFFSVWIVKVLLSLLNFLVKNFAFPIFKLLVLSPFKASFLDLFVCDLDADHALNDDVKFVALVANVHDVVHALEDLKAEEIAELLLILPFNIQIFYEGDFFKVLLQNLFLFVRPVLQSFFINHFQLTDLFVVFKVVMVVFIKGRLRFRPEFADEFCKNFRFL